METITSAANPLIKTLRALDRKKTRAETGWFLAEGARLVREGLDQGWRPTALLVSQSAAAQASNADVLQRAEAEGARVVSAPDRLLASVARKDNPQTLIAAFEQRGLSLSDLKTDRRGALIALHEVRDPGNLGTILRTADCAGARGVVLIGTCCDPYSVEAVRASMGSVFDTPFAAADFNAFDLWRRAQGLKMIAASVNGRSRHTDVEFGDDPILLMGNEQAGLPPDVEAACDGLALIPMRGGADSLNLAQATALMVYEAWRQTGFEGARKA